MSKAADEFNESFTCEECNYFSRSSGRVSTSADGRSVYIEDPNSCADDCVVSFTFPAAQKLYRALGRAIKHAKLMQKGKR